MANVTSFFTNFFSFFLLVILHLGCFIFTAEDHSTSTSKKRKISPLSHANPSSSHLKRPAKTLSSSWSYIKKIFSSKSARGGGGQARQETPALTSARSSQNSLLSLIPPEPQDFPRKKPFGPCPKSEISSDYPLSPLRNDIFPCTACGEIFQKPHLLEQHQAIKHAISELIDGDSGKNIVRIIFKTGWSTDTDKTPNIHRILKIHNSPKILSRFEEYREIVKSKAARGRIRDERCVADGNELLRFHCSTFLCDFGVKGNSSVCYQQYCSICGIIKSGFSPKIDGISTFSNSWRAHSAIPEEIEEEFRFMGVKRAMLVCRVIAGRVGCDSDESDKEDGGGFDSVLGRGGTGVHTRLDEDELLVFNPRAVLPCFVIVYMV